MEILNKANKGLQMLRKYKLVFKEIWLYEKKQEKASALFSCCLSAKESRRDVHPPRQQGALVLLHRLHGEQVPGHQHQRLFGQVAHPLLLPPRLWLRLSKWTYGVGKASPSAGVAELQVEEQEQHHHHLNFKNSGLKENEMSSSQNNVVVKPVINVFLNNCISNKNETSFSGL